MFSVILFYNTNLFRCDAIAQLNPRLKNWKEAACPRYCFPDIAGFHICFTRQVGPRCRGDVSEIRSQPAHLELFRSSAVAGRTPVNPIRVKIDTAASLQRAASSPTAASQRNWSLSFKTAGELVLHNEVPVSRDKCVSNQTVSTTSLSTSWPTFCVLPGFDFIKCMEPSPNCPGPCQQGPAVPLLRCWDWK